MTKRSPPPSCQCGCGLDRIDSKVQTIIELLSLEFPQIEWTSGSRCQKYNKKVRGSKTSGHLPEHGDNGQSTVAVDGTVIPWDNWLVRRIIWRSIQHGCMGIGLYYYIRKSKQNSFHIDRKPRIQFWKRWLKGVLAYFFK